MKKALFLTVVLFETLMLFSGAVSEAKDQNAVTVYSYDSFSGEWGPGPEVIPLFEEETGIKVNLIEVGGAAELVNRLILEGDNTSADVAIGISDDYASEEVLNLFSPYKSQYADTIREDIIFDKEFRLTPFDWGTFAFVYDTQSGIDKPESLEDLTDEKYDDKVILIDPRTSSVGSGLLSWTKNALGEDGALSWWEKMKDNALTIPSGWSSAYGLFTEGEAPLVISYTTSPVYHVMNEDTIRYEALIFQDGHQATIEGVGILKNAKNRENAEKFIDFILSEAQEEIAVLNSMYPVNASTELPSAYSYAPVPEKIFTSDLMTQDERNTLLKEWEEVMTN